MFTVHVISADVSSRSTLQCFFAPSPLSPVQARVEMSEEEALPDFDEEESAKVAKDGSEPKM